MKKFYSYKTLLIAVFIIAILLRIFLGVVNIRANDDHFEIIQIMTKERRIPIMTDCWECHQPKLFYFTSMVLLQIIPVKNIEIQKIILQLMNSLAGIITLYIIYLFLKETGIDRRLRLIVFSLVSLNPRLIDINVQLTNDSLAILFGTFSLYFIYLFFKYQNPQNFYLAVLFIILANLTKSTALVIFILFFLLLLVKSLANWRILKLRNSYFLYSLIFIFLFMSIVPFYGQYLGKYFRYGSPFIYTKVSAVRPGVISFKDSYFNFKLVDLLNYPKIDYRGYYSGKKYPVHQNSFWSQLYGRNYFLHFDGWEPSWENYQNILFATGRAVLILALLPTAIFLYGLLISLFNFIKGFFTKGFDYLENNLKLIFIFGALGYFIFLILSSYQNRDISAIKAIYLYPGLICFLGVFLEGLKRIYNYFSEYKKILFLFNTIFIALILFHLLDIFIFFIQLAQIRLQMF